MMRVLIVAAVLAGATSAAAQTGYGASNPGSGFGVGGARKPGSPYSLPQAQAPAASGTSRTYGTPPSAGGGFKPYEGFKGTSVYSAPKTQGTGSKPCTTSVYVNACDRGR
ncbi:MAG: hypothetical protein AB1942_22045 [Pseudomonadota bacterium]